MAEVTLTINEEAPEATSTETLILGVPVSQIPPPPWTVETLGWERYQFLSRFGGYQTSPQPSFTPALDPRTFAHGVAYKRIEKLLLLPAFADAQNTINRRALITKILDGRIKGIELRKYVVNDAAMDMVLSVIEEAMNLRDFMAQLCGDPTGTPYNQGAIDGAPKIARELMKPRKFTKE